MGGSSLPPSLDAGPLVVAIPPVPATADASADSADDAAGSVAMARQTLGSVCVDDGFVDVQDVALSPNGAALQMCLGTGGSPARNECFALSLAEGVYREIPRTARRAAAAPRRAARAEVLPPYVRRKTKDGKTADFLFGPDRSRLFVARYVEEDAPGGAPMWWTTYGGELYDARTERLLSSFPLVASNWKTSLTKLQWLDDAHVYARETVMEFEFQSAGHLVDVTTGTDKPLGACDEDDDLVHVADDVWVFGTENRLEWIHAHDGSVLRTLDVDKLGIVSPLVVAGRHGDIVVVSRAVHLFETRGDVLVVDAASGAVLHKHVLAKCPAPPG
jgi:hypothetical protein